MFTTWLLGIRDGAKKACGNKIVCFLFLFIYIRVAHLGDISVHITFRTLSFIERTQTFTLENYSLSNPTCIGTVNK